jgi:hypothetical protein
MEGFVVDSFENIEIPKRSNKSIGRAAALEATHKAVNLHDTPLFPPITQENEGN